MNNNKKIILYPGWELKYFDKALNFRNYQFSLFEKYLSGSLAEVGPGNCIHIKKYIKKASKITLFEPSTNFYSRLKKIKSPKVKLIKNYFNSKKNNFDAIICLDVIEHIKDDKREVKKLINSLRKGGKLIIIVPAFNFLYSKFDQDIGHFRRYSKRNIKFLFKKLNCKILENKYFDSIGFCLSLLSKFFTKNYKKNIKYKINFWDKLIPISKFMDKIINFSFGKSLMIILEKEK